jgi:hypothetical protein
MEELRRIALVLAVILLVKNSDPLCHGAALEIEFGNFLDQGKFQG